MGIILTLVIQIGFIMLENNTITILNDNVDGYSIIISAYKTYEYIEECLDSVMLQTFFKENNNFEILLGIDNCPNTLKKINNIQYKYPKMRVFYMSKNVGTYVTSNTLLTLIKYDKIIRFDSDDIMTPNMVEQINSKSYNHDVIRFCFCNFQDNSEKCKKPNNYPAHGAIFYKLKIINELGGYKNWVCGADSDLIYRFKSDYKINIINDVLFYRRKHNESLTVNKVTGVGSDIRNKYMALLKKGFEYIEPITSDYIEIFNEINKNDITYKFNEKDLINNKKKSVTSGGSMIQRIAEPIIESKPIPQNKPEIKSQISSKPQKLFNPEIESKPKPKVKKEEPKPIEPVIEVTPIVKTIEPEQPIVKPEPSIAKPIEPEQPIVKPEPSIVKPNTPQIKSPIKPQPRDNQSKSSISRIPNDLDIGRLRKQHLNFGRR